jgi:hypothetical protein
MITTTSLFIDTGSYAKIKTAFDTSKDYSEQKTGKAGNLPTNCV